MQERRAYCTDPIFLQAIAEVAAAAAAARSRLAMEQEEAAARGLAPPPGSAQSRVAEGLAAAAAAAAAGAGAGGGGRGNKVGGGEAGGERASSAHVPNSSLPSSQDSHFSWVKAGQVLGQPILRYTLVSAVCALFAFCLNTLHIMLSCFVLNRDAFLP
jgi:hypothetical protein